MLLGAAAKSEEDPSAGKVEYLVALDWTVLAFLQVARTMLWEYAEAAVSSALAVAFSVASVAHDVGWVGGGGEMSIV